MKEQEIWNEVKSLHEFIMYKFDSENTAKNYCFHVKSFLLFFRHISRPSDITAEMIINYINQPRFSTQDSKRNVHSAIKFFYKWKCGHKESRKFKFIPYPKKEDKLPNPVTKEEFISIMKVCNNLKHKCVLMLAFDGGLRVSEVINLKIADIDSKQMKITIRQSKGRKDRQIKLSVILLKYLRDYAREYKPNLYLFNGQNGELQYSIRSCQKLFHNYAEKAGIKRKIKFHENRHGYAMSLLENGTDIERIKDLLGHSSSKTTRIYARMNNNVIQRELSPMEQIVGANAIESKYNILHNAT